MNTRRRTTLAFFFAVALGLSGTAEASSPLPLLSHVTAAASGQEAPTDLEALERELLEDDLLDEEGPEEATTDTAAAEAEGEAPPDRAALILDEARAAVGDARYKRAVELLQQYLELKPEDRQVRLELARVLSWDARYAESVLIYDRLVAEDVWDMDLAVERARVMGWNRDYVNAEAAVREILAVEPEHVDANLLLAAVLEWQGKMEEARQVYQWILKFDPENETARSGRQTPPTVTGEGWSLSWRNFHEGDNQDYLHFGTRLEAGMPVLPRIRLVPYADFSLLTQRNHPWYPGIGGGIGLDWTVFDGFTASVAGGVHARFDLPDVLDWQTSLRLAWSPAPWLYLSLRGFTQLYGPIGQSVGALEGGVRAWGGDLSGYLRAGRFTLFGLLTLMGLERDGYSNSLVTTGMLYPMVHLLGNRTRLLAGYKLWFTGHSEPAPLEYEYWSPARYLTHQGLLRVEGPLGAAGSYYVEAGAGVGHEYEPATGVGTDVEEPADWVFFPAFVGGAGLSLPLTAGLTLETGAWTSYSYRTVAGNRNEYVLWHVDANLTYRW